MKITDLHVESFGAWRGLSLRELPDKLTLIYGPNEAGKTTLLQFVRTVLYGFSAQRYHRYVPAEQQLSNAKQKALRTGGCLRLSTAEGNYWVRRYAKSSDPLDGPGELRLTSDDGAVQTEARFDALLSGIDESIFNNVFALGLGELQQLGTLNDTQAAQQLYRLSTGVDRVSLADVVGELQAARTGLLAEDERASQVTDLLSQCAHGESEIEKHVAQCEDWTRLRARLAKFAAESARLEQRRGQLARRSQTIELARSIHPKWEQRQRLDAQLARLGKPVELPAGLLERLETLRAKAAQRRQLLAKSKTQRRRLRQKYDQLPWNETLWRQSDRIRVLSDQQSWISSLDDQVPRLGTQVEEAEFEIQVEQEKLGFAGDQPLPDAGAITRGTLATLRAAARPLRQDRKRLATAKREVVACREQVTRCEKRLAELAGDDAELTTADGNRNLIDTLEQTGWLASCLRRRVQLDDQLRQLDQHRGELDERHGRLIQRQILPLSVLAGISCLFVLGLVLLSTGLFGGLFSLQDASRLFMVLVGSVAAGVAVLMKTLLRRSAAEQLEACLRQYDLIENQVKGAHEELARLDEQIPSGAGSVIERLQAAENRLAALEQLLPVDTERRNAAERARSAEQAAVEAATTLKSSRGRWRSALRDAGLSDTWSPAQVRRLVEDSGRLTQRRAQLEQLRNQLEHRKGELASIHARVTQLMSEASVQTESERLSDQLRHLARAAEEQEQIVQQRQAIRQQSRHMRRAQQKLARTIGKYERRCHSLIASAGVATEEDLQRLVKRREKTAQLTRQRDDLCREIGATIAGRASEQEVAHELHEQRDADLDRSLRRVRREIETIEEKLSSLQHRRGELTQRLKLLQQDRQLAEMQFDLASTKHQLKKHMTRWKVLGVTNLLLETVYRKYERDRQPETLQEASTYLHRFTQGRYTRVWTPLKEDVLRVDQSAGPSLPIEALSRGTREQLFLSLRLALVAVYARRGVQIPMVLDDVLVNFDADRAHAAAELLCDFALSGHQVLVFTCHQHIRSIFQQLGAEVRQLPRLSGLSSAAIDTSTPQKKRSRRRRKQNQVDVVDASPEIVVPMADEEPLEEKTVEEEEIVDTQKGEKGLDEYDEVDDEQEELGENDEENDKYDEENEEEEEFDEHDDEEDEEFEVETDEEQADDQVQQDEKVAAEANDEEKWEYEGDWDEDNEADAA